MYVHANLDGFFSFFFSDIHILAGVTLQSLVIRCSYTYSKLGCISTYWKFFDR